jgi:hypothetical protein
VLLLSVDASYGRKVAQAEPEVRKTMSEHHVSWRSAVDPEGWNGVVRRFNAHGYGLILVGPDGKVLGTALRAEQVERLLAKTYKR